MKHNLLISFVCVAAIAASVHSGRGKTPRATSPSEAGTSAVQANVTPDHIVVVIMENHSFGQIIGSSAAPHINALAAAGANLVNDANDPQGTRSGSHGTRHPSQPNYLDLYAGNNQGVAQDGRPGTVNEPFSSAPPFTTPNLGAALRNAGYSFATYSQTMPSVGFDGDSFGGSPGYQRKHNPVANWMNAVNPTANQLPPSVNQPFTAFAAIAAGPGGFANLPTVSFVVPDQLNDMHDGTIQQGDTWLKTNIIDTYYEWAKTHNSLLILTFDEDGDNTASNQIATIFAGPMINPGNYTEMDLNIGNPYVASPADPGIQTPTGTAMNHFNLLSTLEDLYGLAHIGGSVNRPPVSDVFRSSLIVKPLVAPNAFGGNQAEASNLFPLFSSQPIRYQQVYDALQFGRFAAGGEMINSIAFRAHLPGVPFTAAVPQLQVNLSTTSKTPDNLSSTFAMNTGADDTQVFSGPFDVVVTSAGPTNGPTTFDIVITFSTPFHYDPSHGNLLLDIRNSQGGTENPPLDQQMDATNAAGDSVSRVYNYGDVNATTAGQTGGIDTADTLGLITQFGTSTSPATTPVHLISVASRKNHGGTDFDLDLPLSGTRGIECRAGSVSGEHTMIFTFGAPLSNVENASVTSGTGTVASSAMGSDPHQYVVNLSNVANAQTVTVTLVNLNDASGNSSASVSASMDVLLGDTTANGSVNSSDIGQAKANSGQATTGANFRTDVTANGTINSSDIGTVKANSGTSLP